MIVDEFIDGVKILPPTNTQTRRLGYVTQICKMIRDESYPVLNLIQDLESWASANEELLKENVSDKGIIRKSSTSSAAKRYVKLAQDLELIVEASGYVRPTKTGRVLLALSDACSPSPQNNPFQLSLNEKILLSYQTLLLDSDYLFPVLQLSMAYHSQLDIQEHTQQALLRHLRALEHHAPSQIIRSNAASRITTLLGWKKAKKYSEHLVLPRLHWLLDLELIDWQIFRSKRLFVPNIFGKGLLTGASSIDEEKFASRKWCQNKLFQLWAEFLGSGIVEWSNISNNDREDLVRNHVRIGFSYFRTMEYPRVSAYQLVLFTVIRLMVCEQISAGFEDIKQALSSLSDSSSREWVFYWTAMDDDGYVLLS